IPRPAPPPAGVGRTPMRADQLLVERGLASSRSQAQRLIASGVRWLAAGGWENVVKNGDEPAPQSTGGFADCLRQRGASRVTGVDVGHGQLHANLRRDPRVTAIEKLNAREL